MEYLQYNNAIKQFASRKLSFKPCYKWNTFNTITDVYVGYNIFKSFKPCYKWNTFNTGVTGINEGGRNEF